ncbi:hypothetical protein [Streptomyces sp. 061-3]|uniref:hypothetical protein n=1 Tax=Streptomyces sp. 061-3 TaxID=2789268 RepID=UPI0039811FCC
MEMSRGRAFQVIPAVVGGGILIGSLALRLDNWQDRAFAAAFLLGACSEIFLFLQWRSEGNRVALAWCLAAFGVWALGVIVESVTRAAGSTIFGLSLGIGFVGALTTLFRMARHRRKLRAATLDSNQADGG